MTAPSAGERARQALRRHAPQRATDVRPLGSGLDHTAFVAGDLVLRAGDGAACRREARLLALLAPQLPLPVPEPVFVDEERGVLAYRLLPGEPLLGREPPPGAATAIGVFLGALHGVDVRTVAGLVPTGADHPRDWLAGLEGPPELLAVLADSVPAESLARCLVHADLGAEHLLEAGGRVTGVIDWSDAAVGDPALDLARLYRDFGPAFLDEVLSVGSGAAPERDRIVFFARCAALEDLAYGRRTGRTAYTAAAERSLRWLFRQR